MKILHVVEADDRGGAARAAARLHRSLCAAGAELRMLVQNKHSDDPRVLAPHGRVSRIYELLRWRVGNRVTRREKTTDSGLRSGNWLPSGRHRKIARLGVDVVNLHWVNHEMLSIEEIGRLEVPLVWTLHDMWAFCGTEHYTSEAAEARWRVGYGTENRDPNNSGPDLEMAVWQRKRRAWRRKFQIVTPSNWLADCVRSSVLLRDFPVRVIPNVVDTGVYRPLDRIAARKRLGLPPDRKYILFGAMGGGRLPRKGFDLLQESLQRLAARIGPVNWECLVFGQDAPPQPPDLGFPVHWMGHIDDEEQLVRIYNAADVAVIPSRQDVLAQTATEAQACGIPIVAFAATGVVDAFEDGRTGKRAEAFDTEDLGRSIAWVLGDDERWRGMSENGRARALRLWRPEAVAAEYRDAYAAAIDDQGGR